MTDSNFCQDSFLGGEWSPFVQGRLTIPAYKTGMNVCRNGFPIEEGAWVRRSGTRFAAPTLGGAAGRVMAFAFEQTSPYILELTATAMRMFAVAQQVTGLTTAKPTDFTLVTTNDNRQVTDFSAAVPGVVTVSAVETWVTGDQVVFLFDVSTAISVLPLFRNRVLSIIKITTATFSLVDSITGSPMTGNVPGWPGGGVTPGQVVVARVLQITTPYTGTTWSSVRKVQAEQTAFLMQGNFPPQQLTALTLPTTANFATFTLAAAVF